MLRLIAAVLLAGVLAAPSMALPSIRLVQTGAATGRLEVIVTDSGSIAAELSLVDFGGAALTNVAINSARPSTPRTPATVPSSPARQKGATARGSRSSRSWGDCLLPLDQPLSLPLALTLF